MSIEPTATAVSSPESPLGGFEVYKLTQERIALECHVSSEDDGRYSVYASSLPGVVSWGNTLEEAFKNIVEAFRGVAAEYQRDGGQIPWQTQQPLAAGETRYLVMIDINTN